MSKGDAFVGLDPKNIPKANNARPHGYVSSFMHACMPLKRLQLGTKNVCGYQIRIHTKNKSSHESIFFVEMCDMSLRGWLGNHKR